MIDDSTSFSSRVFGMNISGFGLSWQDDFCHQIGIPTSLQNYRLYLPYNRQLLSKYLHHTLKKLKSSRIKVLTVGINTGRCPTSRYKDHGTRYYGII